MSTPHKFKQQGIENLTVKEEDSIVFFYSIGVCDQYFCFDF